MEQIISDIGFADATYRSCETKGQDLMVYLTSWDNQTIEITFRNAIQFVYRLGWVVENVYEMTGNSPFFTEALSSYYVKVPVDHPFKLFAIKDIDDLCFLEVVAETISISKK